MDHTVFIVWLYFPFITILVLAVIKTLPRMKSVPRIVRGGQGRRTHQNFSECESPAPDD